MYLPLTEAPLEAASHTRPGKRLFTTTSPLRCICYYLALRQARRSGKVIAPIDFERGGIQEDPTRISAIGDTTKGGRWGKAHRVQHVNSEQKHHKLYVQEIANLRLLREEGFEPTLPLDRINRFTDGRF